MPLTELLATLERDAEAKAAADLEAARAAAARVEAEATARADRRRAAYITRRQAELQAAVERAVAVGRREAHAAVLAARERLLVRVFDAAKAAVPAALSDPAFLARLPEQVAAALAYLGPGRATLRCRPEIAAAARAALGGQVTVAEDPTAGTGVWLASEDGVVEVDDTLEARLERWRPRLALRVLRLMERQ